MFWSCDCGALIEGEHKLTDETQSCSTCGRTYRIRKMGAEVWRISLVGSNSPAPASPADSDYQNMRQVLSGEQRNVAEHR